MSAGNPPVSPGPLGSVGAKSKAASWFNAVALVLAITGCAVLGVIITTRQHAQFDRTATREHELTARTKQVLSRVDRDLRLVVAADVRSMDHATYQRTVDVLDKFERAGGRLKVDLIRTSEPAGQEAYERVLTDLVKRDKASIDAAIAQVLACSTKADGAAGSIDTLQEGLLKLREQAGSAAGGSLSDQYLQTEAATLRVALRAMKEAGGKARSSMTNDVGGGLVPPIDKAVADLRLPVSEAAQALGRVAEMLDPIALNPQAGEVEKAAVGAVMPRLRAARDATAGLSVDLEAIRIPRVLKVARGLQLRQAALLIDESPTTGLGVVPIDVDRLLAAGASGVDLRGSTEDLIAGAVTALVSGVRPIVCVVHGAPKRLAAADWPMFQRVGLQLSMRGIDLVEWPVVLEREMPTAVATDSPSRPVVFVTLTAGGGTRDTAQSLAAGIAAYSAALNTLVSTGRNVLVSVNLSNVPATGSPDPLTQCLVPLGIEVDSGRPLLRSEKVDTRIVANPRIDILDPHADHPISKSMSDLRLRLQWPVTINATNPAPGVSVQPLVTVPATGDGTLWVESEWQQFYQMVGQLKGDYSRIANPPTKDSDRDGSAQGAGWTLGLAAEVSVPGRARQRIVVVGANGWFLDDLTNAQGTVDGRPVTFFPGNLQLFESSVSWLAGQDDQISRSASVAATPLIPALSVSQQSWLRWLLVLVLPALVLATGAAYRVFRP